MPTGSSPRNTENGLQGMKILTKEDWAVFRQRFQEFSRFSGNTKRDVPKLTSAETCLFLLLKNGFQQRRDCRNTGHFATERFGAAATG
ncbi:MAG: hypothetical protein R2788_20175 [Saprospiraceae bacterium]